MNVILNKNKIIKVLRSIVNMLPKKGTIPILLNFLFKAKNNVIELSATNLEITVRWLINGEIIEEGSIVIPAKKFLDIIKNFRDLCNIEIFTNDTKQIIIKSEQSKFKIFGFSEFEYPKIPILETNKNFLINRNLFISVLKKTIFSASKDQQEYIINSVFLMLKNGRLDVVSTDGKRLSYVKLNNINNNDIFDFKIIISLKTAFELIRLIPLMDNINIKIGILNKQMFVLDHNINIFLTTIDGIFPDYEQIILKVKKLHTKVNVETKKIFLAIKQMISLSKRTIAINEAISVKFSFSLNNLKISTYISGIGYGESLVKTDYTGELIELNFNPVFIIEILQNIDSKFITFKFFNSIHPVVIQPQPIRIDLQHIYVVMPLKI